MAARPPNSPAAELLRSTQGKYIELRASRHELAAVTVLTMPEIMSTERVALLRHLGADLRLTPGILMHDAVALARQIAVEEGAVWLNQFDNPANAQVHRDATAEEIWRDAGGRVDVFVSAVGTGGTITGVGEVKARNPQLRCVAVEPASAAVLSGQPAGAHKIPGIGVGFVPPVLNRGIVHEIVMVSDDEAFSAARRLATEEGILSGASAGAALHAALTIAERPDMRDKTIVMLMADSAERYVTTDLIAR